MTIPSFTVESLAAKIRTRRGALELTQAELARSVGASRKFIVDLESGKETVATGLVLRVLKRLGFEEPGLRLINDRGTDIAQDLRHSLRAHDYEFALRLVSEYSTESLEAGYALLDQSPELEESEYQVALAAVTRWIADQTQTAIPQWATDIVRSMEPVFLSEKLYPVGEQMKEIIRAETPLALQELNVWMRERSLRTL